MSDSLLDRGADRLAASAGRAVDARADEWVTRGLASARTALTDRVATLDAEADAFALAGVEPPQARRLERVGLELAGPALTKVDGRAGSIAFFARDKARSIMIHVASGNEGNARRLALASTATFAERRAASAASTSSTSAQSAARAQATEDMISLGKDAGEGLLHALPFILAAL